MRAFMHLTCLEDINYYIAYLVFIWCLFDNGVSTVA